jgi:hypothetical protein
MTGLAKLRRSIRSTDERQLRAVRVAAELLGNRGGLRTFAALCTKARFAGQSTISLQFDSSFEGPSRYLSELRFSEFHCVNKIVR